MKELVVFICFCSLSICFADVSSLNRGPYQSSGWQPSSGPALVYGPPPSAQSPSSVEISKENIQFAGQIQSVVPAAAPNNAYLPPPASPAKESQIVSQGLPKENSPVVFTNQIKQLNTGEVFFLPQPQESPFRQDPAQFRQTPSQYRNQEFRPFQQQQQQQQQQRQQFRQPAIQQAPIASSFTPQFLRQQVYGAPQPPSTSTPPVLALEPEDTEDDTPNNESDDVDDNGEPVVAIANASGQYYILGKDNALQRVVYMTAQTEDDIINNGFTAQLRYAPVEPIRDPIYAYNTQGQLVKLYNKKK